MKTGENRLRTFAVLFAALLLAAAFCACAARDPFPSWSKDAPAVGALKEYVDDVCGKRSPDYIPPEERIAVFDMDGTLYGEKAPIYIEWLMLEYRALHDPSYTAPEDVKAAAEKIAAAAETGVIPPELELEHAHAAAKAFSGMTVEEYEAYVREFVSRDAAGFSGATYARMWYQPMLEVVDYLNAHDFTVYICSGTDRLMCRALAENVLEIPPERIIGMDVLLEAEGQDGADGLEYVYTENDTVVRSDELLVKNVKANKVSQIAQEIGRQPVLAFGNSSGDISMALYVTRNNPNASAAFMLIADDTEREYGDPEKAADLRARWEGYGWNVISMHDDFRTIYGSGVKRTDGE